MTDDVTGDVTTPPKESQPNDPDAPWRFSLRGRNRDRAIVQRVIDAHERMGINLSQNEAVLVLIRRSAMPDADSQEEAWQAIEHHWSECRGGCDFYRIKCPEGWRLRDQVQRVKPRDPAWTPTPPPGHIPPPLPAAPEQPASWRRYLRFERKAG